MTYFPAIAALLSGVDEAEPPKTDPTLAAVLTLATLAGLDGLAQGDSTAHLAKATATATRG